MLESLDPSANIEHWFEGLVIGPEIELSKHLIGFDQPEGDPGAHDNDCQWHIDLQKVKAERSLKCKLQKDDRSVSLPQGQNCIAVGPVYHGILS